MQYKNSSTWTSLKIRFQGSLAEQGLHELVAREFRVSRDLIQDLCQGAYTPRIVGRDCNVMLNILEVGGETRVASGLPLLLGGFSLSPVCP
jgi:hypothetical protein